MRSHSKKNLEVGIQAVIKATTIINSHPSRTIQHGNGRFRAISKISWKQYPMNGSGDRNYPVPPGTDRSLLKPAAGHGYRNPASNSWSFRQVPAGNGKFSAEFRRKFMECCFRKHRPWQYQSKYIILIYGTSSICQYNTS